MSNELYEKTRRLINQLNHFIVHVVAYFFVNIVLILTAIGDVGKRWWIFVIVIAWAIGIIYHGLRIYGVDPFSTKNKKSHIFWSWVLKLSGVS